MYINVFVIQFYLYITDIKGHFYLIYILIKQLKDNSIKNIHIVPFLVFENIDVYMTFPWDNLSKL